MGAFVRKGRGAKTCLIALISIVLLSCGLTFAGPLCSTDRENLGTHAYADTAGSWQRNSAQNTWRYLKTSGKYATDEWVSIDGTYYYFDGNQAMRTGWISSQGHWYYCQPSGAMVTGWRSIGGAWYYFNSTGAMAVGWRSINDAWYYFNTSGIMQTGWCAIGGAWYHLSASGAMQTGWIYAGGSWYYLNSSGAMVTGWRNVDSAWYHFRSNGAMDRGWLKEGATWYYLYDDGKAAQDWTRIGNSWYYFFPSSCKMATHQYIGNYWVNDSGAWDATQYSASGLIAKVNQARNREGLPTLKWSQSLANTAAIRAREAAEYFSHTRPNGEPCFTIYPSGFLALGENLAAGPNSVEEAHQGWMNSPSHRACLLDKDFNVMGAACISFDDGYNYYWVECFGRDLNV